MYNKCIINIDKSKLSFLKDECWMLSILGAFAVRNKKEKIYKDQTSEKQKNQFKEQLRSHIEKLVCKYYMLHTVNEQEHIEILKSIQDWSKKFEGILNNGELKLGIVQKLFNLYLKYLWCLGLIPMPPHFPIDGIILEHLRKNLPPKRAKALENINWTVINSVSEYQKIINEAKFLATKEKLPLAVWELYVFNQKR